MKIINERKHVIFRDEEEDLLKKASNSQFPPSILLIDPRNEVLYKEVH